MSVYDSLSEATRTTLAAVDVNDDMGLETLGRAELDEWVTGEEDRSRIRAFQESRASGHPMVMPTLMPLGLADGPPTELQERVVIAHHYQNCQEWSAVNENPGLLVQKFRDCPWLPTHQRHGSCASHTTGTAIELRANNPLDDQGASPSRASLHLLTGEVGGHGPNEGRSYATVQEVLFEHGYLTEGEFPTGNDEFEEDEVLTPEQKEVARRRALYGAGWVDGSHGRLNFALDCVSGRVTGEPVGLQIAVDIYPQWQKCFRSGVIRRHSSAEDDLLGAHAVELIGFQRRHGKIWAVIANSWGTDFGVESPLGTPGMALISTSYLREILCHGAVLFARDEKEFERMAETMRANSTEYTSSFGAPDRAAATAAYAPAGAPAPASALEAKSFDAYLTNNGLLLLAVLAVLGIGLAAPLGQYVGVLIVAFLLAGFLLGSLPHLREGVQGAASALGSDAQASLRRRRASGRIVQIGANFSVLLGAALVALAGWGGLPPAVLVLLAVLVGLLAPRCHDAAQLFLIAAASALLFCALFLGGGLAARVLVCAIGLLLLWPALPLGRPLSSTGAPGGARSFSLLMLGACVGFLLALL